MPSAGRTKSTKLMHTMEKTTPVWKHTDNCTDKPAKKQKIIGKPPRQDGTSLSQKLPVGAEPKNKFHQT
jgi:hypothetical protein